MSCTVVADLTTWHLGGMEVIPVNGTAEYYNSGNLTWNMCSYMKSTETFA